jgi:hypothetical protein
MYLSIVLVGIATARYLSRTHWTPQNIERFDTNACAVRLDVRYWLLATLLARDTISAASLSSVWSLTEGHSLGIPFCAVCYVNLLLRGDLCELKSRVRFAMKRSECV